MLPGVGALARLKVRIVQGQHFDSVLPKGEPLGDPAALSKSVLTLHVKAGQQGCLVGRDLLRGLAVNPLVNVVAEAFERLVAELAQSLGQRGPKLKATKLPRATKPLSQGARLAESVQACATHD